MNSQAKSQFSIDSSTQSSTPCRRLSRGPKHHFFGYYGINPWDKSGRFHLALETDFQDHRPTADDIASVGLVDKHSGLFIEWAKTRSFNLQQGSMMHWFDVGQGEEFTYNDTENGRLVSRVVNFATRKVRTVQGAIAAVSPTEAYAIGLNFHRMALCRAVVGYATNPPPPVVDVPEDEGLFALDLKTGESKLLISHAEVIRQNVTPRAPEGRAWFNHVLFNPSGTRFMFLCRVKQAEGWKTSMWTANADGSELECQVPWGHFISHFYWRDDERLLITTDILGHTGFVEFTDRKRDFHPVAKDILPPDGHGCYSPDRQWILTDVSYRLPPDFDSELMLVHVDTHERVSLGHFLSDQLYQGDIRCDLHPRWSPDGKTVTIDSVHEGDRQIYEIDVSGIV